MVLGKIISSEGYTFGQKWIISMIFRSFFITCIHKYGPNSVAASKMISIFMIFFYLYGIFWYCEVRSVGSLTLIKSRFGRGVCIALFQKIGIYNPFSIPALKWDLKSNLNPSFKTLVNLNPCLKMGSTIQSRSHFWKKTAL